MTCLLASRTMLLGSLVALILSSSTRLAEAQAKAQAKSAAENVTFITDDNVQLRGTYFPSGAGSAAPVAVLLHGKGGNRLVWQAKKGQAPSFAEALNQNDFAVVTVDLRGHGESVPGGNANAKKSEVRLTPRDYRAMVAMDMEAVKKFLFEQHQAKKLNMNKLGIVAADFSTGVAVNYAEMDWLKKPYDDAPIPAQRTPRGQDVKALVLLSPDTSVPGLVTNQAATFLREMRMPVMIGVGKKDKQDRGSAKKLSDQLMPKQEGTPYVFLHEYDTTARGTDMLNLGIGVEPQMYRFLDENVKKLPGEWRDRKSPLLD